MRPVNTGMLVIRIIIAEFTFRQNLENAFTAETAKLFFFNKEIRG